MVASSLMKSTPCLLQCVLKGTGDLCFFDNVSTMSCTPHVVRSTRISNL